MEDKFYSRLPDSVKRMLQQGIELDEIPLSLLKKQKTKPKPKIDILFSCTSLKNTSTFVKNFETIQKDLIQVVPEYKESKNAYFVNIFYDKNESGIDDIGKELLEKNNYHLVDDKINFTRIIDFLQTKSSIKFDVIIFAQCNNLVDIFNFDKGVDLNQRIQQIINLYDSLKDKGIIINYYYTVDFAERMKQTTKDLAVRVDIQDFIALINIYRIIIFVFLRNVFTKLFLKLDIGIYQKKKVKNIEKIIMDCYLSALDEIEEIYKASFIDDVFNVEKYIDLINQSYLKNQYSKQRLKKEIDFDALRKSIQSVFEK